MPSPKMMRVAVANSKRMLYQSWGSGKTSLYFTL